VNARPPIIKSQNTERRNAVLLIYTGGTIGMVADSQTGQLIPFDFQRLLQFVPELQSFDLTIETCELDTPIDSSDMQPEIWVKLANLICQHYHEFDGFVILHGTDTMSYTAAALSFLLQNLGKPVVLTGSQLPMGIIRTDGKENLITAIEIASRYSMNLPLVPEVSVYFEYKLYRGNRTHKYNVESFNAFHSPNYPLLAEAGVLIHFNQSAILPPGNGPLIVYQNMCADVAILKLFPGISQNLVEGVLAIPGLKGIVLETFGSGNAPNQDWFNRSLKSAIDRGMTIVNVTQCSAGRVEMGRYSTGLGLQGAGVIGSGDMTSEAAIVKLMWLFGKEQDPQTIRQQFLTPLAGEVTITE
jgi:L-asparaginase